MTLSDYAKTEGTETVLAEFAALATYEEREAFLAQQDASYLDQLLNALDGVEDVRDEELREEVISATNLVERYLDDEEDEDDDFDEEDEDEDAEGDDSEEF